MFERYFIRPDTIDRLRASWIGEPVERYVTWLHEQGYAARTVFRRVPVLVQFGEFARSNGAVRWEDLPAHISAFSSHWLDRHGAGCKTERDRTKVAFHARGAIEQMLNLALPGFIGAQGLRRKPAPFKDAAAGFFGYLADERGLKPRTLELYAHYLRKFQAYLAKIGLANLAELSPAVLAAFVVDQSPGLARTSVRDLCGTLRVFLRFLHRDGMIPRDLSLVVDSPQAYRLATIPRSISWDEVRRTLEAVDRRTAVGRRDYAILLLLVTYGLRAHEVAAITLDQIDWRRERLRVPERKAGHSTAYPLSSVVGAALLDYIQHGRPNREDRHVFFRALPPLAPYTSSAISSRTAHYMRKAGIEVARPGSHTLRHTCVQRLVDADFSFKVIGDYVGHRTPDSTEIYTKVAVEALRELALGDGEEIL